MKYWSGCLLIVVAVCLTVGPAWAKDDTEKLDYRVAQLEQRIQYLEEQLAAVLQMADHLRYEEGPINSLSGPHIIFSGANVHVWNGEGRRAEDINGLGNLLIGYNICPEGYQPSGVCDPMDIGRGGSHNLVIGHGHQYSNRNGFVAGFQNIISGLSVSVSGGRYNEASGRDASISGGYENIASGDYSCVSGGAENQTIGSYSSVSGGLLNRAWDDYTSILGGNSNATHGSYSSVSGGSWNHTNAEHASISGGSYNEVTKGFASISGGMDNTANGAWSTVSGGAYNTVTNLGPWSTVSGGRDNTANHDYSTVSGGYGLVTTSDYDHIP